MDVNRHYIEEVNRELVAKAVRGDYDAFGELYKKWVTGIYRYVYYMVKDKMTADDLTEEIFLKAWKSLASYRGQGQSFSAWLFRIAHNHVMDEFRSKSKFQCINLETAGMQISCAVMDPEQETERKMMRDSILEKVASLPEPLKQVIIFKFVEGLNNKEIEQVTGKSQGAIRISQMRALAMLREKMGEEVKHGR
jgi:RNA polymerase sigma-70 factor (ECF subfamily)